MPVSTRRITPSRTAYPVKKYPYTYSKTARRLCVKRSIPQIGFENLVNTCWMNATLQVFLRLPMAHKLVNYARFEDPESLTLQKYLAKLFNGDHHQTRYDVLNLNTTTEIRDYCRVNYHLTDGIQHDPTEFLQNLVLVEPFAAVTQITVLNKLFDPTKPSQDDEVEQLLRDNMQTLMTNNHYAGYLHENRVNFTIEHMLRLSIFDEESGGEKKPLHTLEDCLYHHFKQEFPYDKIIGKETFLQQTEIYSPWPKVLVVVLNRYGTVGTQTTKDGKKHVQTGAMKHFVNIPEILETHGERYKMHGFVSHKGKSLDSGHYIAHVRKRSNGHWFMYSDTRVTDLDEEPVSRSKKVAKALTYDEHFNDPSVKSDDRYILVYVKMNK